MQPNSSLQLEASVILQGNDSVQLLCSVNGRVSTLENMAEVHGNNFCILGIPLQRSVTHGGFSFLTPAPGQVLSISDPFKVMLACKRPSVLILKCILRL